MRTVSSGLCNRTTRAICVGGLLTGLSLSLFSTTNNPPKAPPAPGTQINSQAPALPGGLTGSDWNGIRAEYERRRRDVVQEGQEYQAWNGAQQMLTRFDGRGFLVEPDGTDWRWGLELRRYGFGGCERELAAPVAAADGHRMTYSWGYGLEEWYVNQAAGVEHGFTVTERPQAGNGPLAFEFSIRGGLEPRAHADANGLSFVDAAGQERLHYAGLKAWDAGGRPLPARLIHTRDSVRLEVEEANARYPITIDPFIQQAFLKASNADPGDQFGVAVAISGDTVVVGARGEASSGPGAPANNDVQNAGAAYVFVRNNGGWAQQAILKAEHTDPFDNFGEHVAISGNTVVVSAASEDSSATGGPTDDSTPQSGAVYVFVRNNGVWTQQAFLKASNAQEWDLFGNSVAIENDRIVVGALWEDSSATGGPSDNSTTNAGAAYVFVRNNGFWTQQAMLKASNASTGHWFGFSVALHGNTIAVGALGEDSSAGGGPNDHSAPNAGAAYVFVWANNAWTEQARLKAFNAEQGDSFASVALHEDTLVVGAYGEDSSATGGPADNSVEESGAAYVFTRSGAVWTHQAFLKASNAGASDLFGKPAIEGDTIVIGASGESSSASLAGAIYIFERTNGAWTQQALLKASNPGARDFFGWSVAISGETVVTGALRESSSATGGQDDNSALDAGAAYIFRRPGSDLSIRKSAPASINSGQEISYTLGVTNNGPRAASSVVASDVLPASTSFVSCATTKGECAGSGNNRSVNIGTLDSGAEATVTLVASVACSLPDASLLRNNASVTSATYDHNEGDNSDSVQTTVLNPAPVVQASVGVPALWPANHNLVNVAFAASATDNCGTPNLQVRVYSNEADRTDTGGGAHSPDAAQIAPGTLRLRAERAGGGEGRVYLIVATATDSAGGVGVNAATVVVPKSQSAPNVSAVTAQAAAARAYALANSGNPPPGYIQVGTGPVIGSKQ